jgi:hypothetical protein
MTSYFVRHVGIWPPNNLKGMLEAHKLYVAQKGAIKKSGRRIYKRMVMAWLKNPRDITKIKCFNYNNVGHYAKISPKIR